MRDDMAHPIHHTGYTALRDGNAKYKCINDIMNDPTITKKLVCIKQILEQGMQVFFTSSRVLHRRP